mmetsp:Transcript_19859/g.29706  ORF Transcript_19859/g.29706 Transcript_19859/m.29706 type:complete len:104 (-) Transcript_19859:772-1083(-)
MALNSFSTSPPRPRSGMFHSSTTSILTFLIVAAVATCMYANFWFLNHDVPIIPLALALEQTAINWGLMNLAQGVPSPAVVLPQELIAHVTTKFLLSTEVQMHC